MAAVFGVDFAVLPYSGYKRTWKRCGTDLSEECGTNLSVRCGTHPRSVVPIYLRSVVLICLVSPVQDELEKHTAQAVKYLPPSLSLISAQLGRIPAKLTPFSRCKSPQANPQHAPRPPAPLLAGPCSVP
eukprot:1707115-Rhodomonas_salina.1